MTETVGCNLDGVAIVYRLLDLRAICCNMDRRYGQLLKSTTWKCLLRKHISKNCCSRLSSLPYPDMFNEACRVCRSFTLSFFQDWTGTTGKKGLSMELGARLILNVHKPENFSAGNLQ